MAIAIKWISLLLFLLHSKYSLFCSQIRSFFFLLNVTQVLTLLYFNTLKVKVKSFSHVQLFVTPWTVAYQAPPSMGFYRQEYWSGLPFPSPMHDSEEWKWSHSVMSDSLRPHGLQPIRLLCPWDFTGKSTGVGCHVLLQRIFPTRGLNLGLPHCR